ncbi:MAG: helix-turn-helix domain-containing protein [Lachnospiraceae bacterium]|nr:helix-turn-helix domain-containing protein [Lachnospiraceae bacterium]
MFRVMIADDENSVVESLLCSIPWEELGLEVAGTASDGTTALELAEKEEISIAILDIRMPGVNGLELCNQLRKRNDRIQLIIASGYAEFAYAEKAIQYGVIGYCLKPLDFTQVTRILHKAVQNLRKDKHMIGWEDLMEILERREENEIRECLSQLGFYQKKYFIAVSSGERKLDALEAAGISVRLGRGQWGYIMKTNRIKQLGDELYQLPDWSGIGYIQQALSGEVIYEAFEECIARAFQYFVDGENKLCSQLDEWRANRWLDGIQKKIQADQWESLESMLEEVGRKGREDFTVRSALRLCNLIFSHSLFWDEENDYYIYSIEQLVNTYGDFSEMLRQLQRFLDENASEAESEQNFTNTTFMKLMKYINENYRGEISLTGAAQVLNMNSNYVSQLFKKETGITFVHYITQKRLEDAKELLSTTKKPLTDIALEVGFNDTFHFIKTFKKVIGMTPGQYRMSN